MKSLILAGGKGTRLRPLTYAMAKQLVPVANQPILFYGLDQLYQAGVREFGIIISPETGESIQHAVALWQPKDAQITYIPQDKPSGLAHAVKTARPFLGNAPFIMYLGDNLINIDLADLVERFERRQSDALILLKPVENPSAFGVAEIKEDGFTVKRLVEKPKNPKSNLALIGVYFFTAKIFEAVDKIQPSWRGELEITDAIQKLLDEGSPVDSHIHEGWWLDTGKKDDLLAANRTVLGDYIRRCMILGHVCPNSEIQGMVEVDAEAEIIKSKIIGPVRIGRGVRIENSVIGPNTSIGPGCIVLNSHIENSVLLDSCQVKNIAHWIRNSLVGNFSVIQGKTSPDESIQLLVANHSELTI